LAKAADKQNRRFSVIRGRKPRPVASAKPKQVVNFPNVREAIRDESDSDDASEADDEEDDRGEEEPSTTGVDQDLEQSLGSMVDSTTSVSTAQDSTAPTSSSDSLKSPIEAAPLSPPITIPDVMLPTPTPLPTGLDVIHSISSDQAAPSSDFELPASYNDKNYFTRALSKFFPTGISNLQALNRALTNDFDTEDAFADPEHIFRESDIVVRTDEPTSMIALTLE
jgi:1-phosphatidylinositol-3-phosphate 5-kinase